jgi:UDP-N-acetylmuramyl pentapeptide phosphotransferase/UDP-N-acetylglucosamine-1-phosphate transferase
MGIGTILIGFLTSLAISFFAIPSIVKVARNKGLYGIPRDGKPKKTPTLGGLAIFAGILIPFNFFIGRENLPVLPFLTAGSIIFFFIGIKDDILVIAPWWKLLGQLIVALGIVMAGQLQLSEPARIIGIDHGGIILNSIFSLLVIVYIINAFNLIDGIDGLAAGIGMLSSLLFGIVFYQTGEQAWSLLAATVFGSLAGFSWYNVFSRKKRILMGDTGSLIIGFLIALMAVRLTGLDTGTPGTALQAVLQNPYAFVFAALCIPLVDLLRVVLIRMIRGRSPLRPDRKHIHYRLIDTGLTHLQSTAILLGMNLTMILLFFVLKEIAAIWFMLMILVLLGLVFTIPERILRKQNKSGIKP